jgi:hypothetical protein
MAAVPPSLFLSLGNQGDFIENPEFTEGELAELL